ncbi:hypothetical protein QJQ45_025932 [Haematococcus lacustris]|nr:hypothetical protein QJQ45_025932 [Haematococcus lacustris]
MAQPPPEDKLRSAQDLLMGTHYVPRAILGEGAFGLVVLARDSRVNNYRAVKLIQRQEQHMQLLRREIKLHWSMDHPHIVRVREVFRAGTTHVGIAMDACTAGSLLDYLETHGHSHAGRKPSEVQGQPVAWGLKEGMARWFLQQLVLALEYCHAREVVHRDIKLENVLLESVQGVPLPLVRLADFGLSRRHNAENPCVTQVGTPAYLAPELLQPWLENYNMPESHTGPQAYDGTKVDVWALGVLLYTLLFYRYPFGSPSSAHLQQAAQAGLGAARVPVTAHGTAADTPMDNIKWVRRTKWSGSGSDLGSGSDSGSGSGSDSGSGSGSGSDSCSCSCSCSCSGSDPVCPGVRLPGCRRLLAADVRYPDPLTAGGRLVSPDCMALLKSMLQLKPADRPSIAEIIATPWFKELLPKDAINMTRNQLNRERQWAKDGVLHRHRQPLEEVIDVIENPEAADAVPLHRQRQLRLENEALEAWMRQHQLAMTLSKRHQHRLEAQLRKCRLRPSLIHKLKQQLQILKQTGLSTEVLRRWADSNCNRLDTHGRTVGGTTVLTAGGTTVQPTPDPCPLEPCDLFIPTQEASPGKPAARTAAYTAQQYLSTARLLLKTQVSRRRLPTCRRLLITEQCVVANTHRPGERTTVSRQLRVVYKYLRQRTLAIDDDMAQSPPEDKLRRAQALLMGTHYVPKAILGEGAFGLVVLAQDSRVNNYRAVKLIQRQGQHMQLLRREIKLHWSMDHPHIVRMREVFRAGTTHVGIAMDACTAGSLLDYLETHGHSHAGRKPSEVQGPPVAWGLKEGMARWFLQQLVLALEYCHAKEVVHRDIKLENVLLESVQGVPLPLVRLADFGLSRRHNAENPCVTHVGTPAYLAPELLQLWLENGSLPLTHTGPQAYDGTKVTRQGGHWARGGSEGRRCGWREQQLHPSWHLEVLVDGGRELVQVLRVGMWAGVTANAQHPITLTACFMSTYIAEMTLWAAYFHACLPASTLQVDVWALGVLLYTLLFHRYPFGSPSSAHLQQAAQAGLGAARVPVTARGTAADNPMDNIRRLLAADVRYPDPPTAGGQPVSSDCMALLKSMLQRDPDKRLSLGGIMATPWFRVLLPEGAIDMTRNQLDRERQWAQDGVLHMHLQPLQEVVDVIMNPVAGPQRLVTTGVTR